MPYHLNKMSTLRFSCFLCDITENASRMCLANGTWSEKTDYSNCSMFEPILEVKNGDYSDVIYMVGYAVSLIALTIALFIFLKFRYCKFINDFTFHKL